MMASLSHDAAELMHHTAERMRISAEACFNTFLKEALMKDMTKNMTPSQKQQFEKALVRCMKRINEKPS
ncbi:hypothetical protein J4219_04800 [Candidatus Woesearchaeota archaeon]|nr:hypothetical protein [Candidatus Woesearchaeota archaeon]